MAIGGVANELHEFEQTLTLNEALKLLVFSLKNKNYAMTEQLLTLKPELQSASFGASRLTPLYIMLVYNPECNETIFRQLMQLPHSINAQNKEGRAVIHLIAQFNRVDLLSILLENKDIDINLKNAEGVTALAMAAQYGHHAIVTMLIEKGANLREKNAPSAIHFACGAAKFASVQALLKHDPSLIAYRDPSNRTPAHYLASTKSTDKGSIDNIIKLFSSEQFSLECNAHATPFETACYFKNSLISENIKSKELLSLYQLSQNKICEATESDFQKIISVLPPIEIKEVLVQKKNRML